MEKSSIAVLTKSEYLNLTEGLPYKTISPPINQEKVKMDECHVCYETIGEGKGVVCEHGHHCCMRHHLERIRAMYETNFSELGEITSPRRQISEAMSVFGAEASLAQCCFMCRCDLPDFAFGGGDVDAPYFKILRLIQRQGHVKLFAWAGLPDLMAQDMMRQWDALMDAHLEHERQIRDFNLMSFPEQQGRLAGEASFRQIKQGDVGS
jgi:hypothetical protein